VPASSETTSASGEVQLPADVDLHARPAATFVRSAMAFTAATSVRAGEREVNAKSLLSVLALGAKRGTQLRLSAVGEDAQAAIDALVATVAGLRE
jgi:phosphotransferase system HPr (HPr) family protein